MPDHPPIPDDQTPPPRAPLFRRYVIYPLLGLLAIAFLLAAFVPRLENHPPELRRRATIADLAFFRTALDEFHVDTGRYPTAAEGLDALITCPPTLAATWKGPYAELIRPDKWGSPYYYEFPSPADPLKYDLHSLGPDKIDGTPDDLTPNPTP